MIIKYLHNDYTILSLFIMSLIGIFIYSDNIPQLFSRESEILIPLVIVTFGLHKLRPNNRKFVELGFGADRTLISNLFITSAMLLLMITAAYITDNIFYYGKYFHTNFNTLSATFPGIGIMLVLVIIEELAFRGLAYQILIEKAGLIAAMIISSLLFTIAHSLNPGLTTISVLNIFLAGLLMSLMFARSGSLFPQILFHFGWNFSLAYIVGSPVSGYNFSSQLSHYELGAKGSFQDLLLGGAFGLEGGLLSTILLICMIVICGKHFIASPFVTSKYFQRNYKVSN